MITQDIINQNYIKKVISRDSKLIYDTQADVIRKNFQNERARLLYNFILKKPFSFNEAPGKVTYYFRIFTYLRFLDIWHSGAFQSHRLFRSNIALYNRVVWGVLYHETLPDLRYGLTRDMQESIRKQLQTENLQNQK